MSVTTGIFSLIGFIFKIIPWVLLVVAILIAIFWKKTIFPKMIAEYKARKAIESQIKYEAKIQAIQELKPALIEAYKAKEVARMTGSTGDKLKRFADNIGIKANPDRLKEAFGGSGNNVNPLDRILGKQQQQPFQQQQYQQQYQQPQQYQPHRTKKSKQRYYQQQPQRAENVVNQFIPQQQKSWAEKQKDYERRMKEMMR